MHILYDQVTTLTLTGYFLKLDDLDTSESA